MAEIRKDLITGRPGYEMVEFSRIPKKRRTQHLILSWDNSPSMNGKKNEILRKTVPELFDGLKATSDEYGLDLFIRLKKFSTDTEWIIGNETYGVPIKDASWDPSLIRDNYKGLTNIDRSIIETAKCIEARSIGGFKPKKLIDIHITDGQPTCSDEELDNAIQSLDNMTRTTRIVIAVGDNYDIEHASRIATEGTIRRVNPETGEVKTETGKLVFECKDINQLPAVINSVSTGSITNSSEDVITINDTDLWM